jgi:putative endonuclease
MFVMSLRAPHVRSGQVLEKCNLVKKTRRPWFVYIIACKDNSLYVGITNDIEERIKSHNLGQGCRYTKSRCPVKLLFCEMQKNRSSATKREMEIKKFSRSKKLKLVRNQRHHKYQQMNCHSNEDD